MQAFISQIAGNSIHNPKAPTHFMWLRPVAQRVTVFHENLVMASTRKAIRVIEVGHDVMAPVLYVPKGDICADLAVAERRSHCPLKGDAVFLNLVDEGGAVIAEAVAWAYVETFEFAADLKDRIAFDQRACTIETTPL